jgi:hypothetical protein
VADGSVRPEQKKKPRHVAEYESEIVRDGSSYNTMHTSVRILSR